MGAPLSDTAAGSAPPPSRPIRTSVLIHPAFGIELEGGDATFLTLPHPRTHIPTYYLSTTNQPLLELASLTDTKFDRSWFIGSSSGSKVSRASGHSTQEEVISKARLEILSAVDPRFLVISILDSLNDTSSDGADTDGVFRTAEDAFEQAASTIYRTRKEELSRRLAALNTDSNDAPLQAMEDDEEWTDIITFAGLPFVQQALRQVTHVQQLSGSGGDSQAVYRLSRAKIYADVLASKLDALSQPATFASSPNVLATTFHRRWPLSTDPSCHIASDTPTESPAAGTEAETAAQLRRQIAAEIIAGHLPPALATDWFKHLNRQPEQ